MAGKNSRQKKDRRSKADKERNKKRKAAPKEGGSAASRGGAMMGMRSGFKRAAGTSESRVRSKSSWPTIIVSAVITAGLLILLLRYLL